MADHLHSAGPGGLHVDTFIRFMHNGLSRIARVIIGWALVVKAVYQPIDLAAGMMMLGSIITIFAIADVCPVEQAMVWLRRQRLVAATKAVQRHA